MKKGIYLCSGYAYHEKHDIVYQDLLIKRDLGGDMLTIDLSDYDFIIATPPCNYWSRANYRREISQYSLSTKLLLPCILYKLIQCGKPFIVENVQNKSLFSSYGLFDLPCFIYVIGGHTYWTNILLNLNGILQINQNKQHISQKKRQGGINVHNVIDVFLKEIN